MKKIFLFSLFIFLFSLFFFKTASSTNAATITCGPDSRYGETWTCDIKCSGTNGCYQTKACGSTLGSCITVAPTKTTKCGASCTTNGCWTCASLGYQCGTLVNNCGQTLKCGSNGSCSDTTKVCSSYKCVAPACQTCASLGYQCGTLVNNCGQTLKCGNNGACADTTKTCSNYQCVVPPPPPSGSGYDCKDNGCIPHTGAGSGTYTDANSAPLTGLQACNRDCISELFPGCPVCTSPYYYDAYTGKCAKVTDRSTDYSTPTYQTCSAEQTCKAGCGCNCTLPKSFTSGALPCGTEGIQCYTAFGWIKLDPASLVKAFFGIVLSISGGIAVLLIILSGYRLIASQGNPEKINEAKEHLTAAIIGLLFVIFSFSFLRFIGVDVLGIFP